jgi:hypothetical protein
MATNPVSSSTTGMVLVGAITDSNVAPSSTSSGAIGIYKKNGVSTNYINTTANTASGTTFGSGTITPSGLVYTVGQNGGASTGVLYSFGLNGTLRSENTISSPFSGAKVVATPTSNVIVSSANVVTCIATTTTPTINWTTAINQSNWPIQTVESVGADSTGNVYVAYYAQHVTSGGVPHNYLVQLNNSGTINWQQDLGAQSVATADLSEIAVDSTGNVYSYGDGVIAKWNNSGTLLWQELLQVTSGAAQGQLTGGILAIDAVDNIYISNPMTFTTSGNVVNVGGQITKLDSNGNLIFSNMLTLGNVANVNINNTFIESAGTTGNVTNVMYLNISTQEAYASDEFYLWNFALPADGSFTGNTWTNSFGGEALQYSALSNVTATATSNISTTTGNLTSSTASTTIGATLGYAFAQQVIPGNLVSLGTSVYPPVTYSASYLIVAGGAGGGYSAGGGAGGLLYGTYTLTPGTTYSFTVGAAGPGGINVTPSSLDGSNSTGFNLTAIGGGGGASRDQDGNGAPGGSGGGGAGSGNAATGAGAGTAGQGNSGGAGTGELGGDSAGGGGGGASTSGTAGSADTGGPGGTGVQWAIDSNYYAGGGGGSGLYDPHGTSSGAGGAGGGGRGGGGYSTGGGIPGYPATVNTGGGGGGGSGGSSGGNGGSGIVAIAVPTSSYTGTTTGSPTVTVIGSNTVMYFTSSGSYTA